MDVEAPLLNPGTISPPSGWFGVKHPNKQDKVGPNWLSLLDSVFLTLAWDVPAHLQPSCIVAKSPRWAVKPNRATGFSPSWGYDVWTRSENHSSRFPRASAFKEVCVCIYSFTFNINTYLIFYWQSSESEETWTTASFCHYFFISTVSYYLLYLMISCCGKSFKIVKICQGTFYI